ncbi:hypothetical protein PMIN03_000818 [Paraphaeosphaeria minitans]|uniref:Uncharacterized protein n=1 Tax=Paraphaeosphaeria minitans TaxID=565426 RepID=A0A9P6GCE9_9PLEO|nr:hypothetical protein PMIN01_09581 [Paraphaeosphaeria minitans]
MRIFLSILVIVSVAFGAVIRKVDGDDSGLLELVPLNESSVLADYEVLFYEDPNFKGAGWGMVPIPNQPSSPDNAGQFCYFVDPGRVSSLKLVKQRNDRKFSCRFFRTTDACQHNIPALTLDWPANAERTSLGPELDNQINSALCWWTSNIKEEPPFKHGGVELHTRHQQESSAKAPHLVDIFTDPEFSGDYTWYMYVDMVKGKCQNSINSDTSSPWSSLKLNAVDLIYHCRFYEPLNCVQDGTTFYFDIQQAGGGSSVRDLRVTNDNKGKPWGNRLRSMKCVAGPWNGELEERAAITVYPVSLKRE